MIRIHQVTLRNWRRVRSAAVVFPAVGTVAVLGSNGDGGYLKSVGAGKTSLGEAVARAVFGIPKKSLNRMSFHRQGDTYVKVEGTIGDQGLVVEIGYKCPELGGMGEGLRYTIGTESVQRADVKDTRAELSAALGINTRLAEWTTFLDGDKLRFSDLTEADQVELLMQALRQPPWPRYRLTAKKKLDEARDHVNQAQGDLDGIRSSLGSTESEITRVQTLVTESELAYRDRLSRFNADSLTHAGALKKCEENLQRAVAKQKLARKTFSELSATAEKKAIEVFKEQREKTTKAYQQAQVTARAAATKVTVATNEYKRQHTEYGKFEHRPEQCPTCGQKWPADEHLEAERNRAYTTLIKAKETLDAAKIIAGEAETTEQQADDADFAVNEATNKHAHALTYRADAELEAAERLVEAAELAVGDITATTPQKPDDGSLLKLRSRLEAEQRLHDRTKKQLEMAADGLVTAERVQALQRYWVEALGPSGIPNQIINRALPPLNTAAKAASTALTGGSIGVSFDTVCELADGDERNRVTVNVDNPRGADEASEFSKGEGGLTNLIISESLSMIGQIPQRCAWRWLDEAINNQDRKHVYGYYRRLAHSNGITVFIVDHHPDALALADHVLVATKDLAGFTTYSWES